MVKKKGKLNRKGKKRAVKEDVKYSTSLPPAVEGQLRCFLRVSVTKIDWAIPKPPDVCHVRVRWWGEAAEGTIFRPLDVKNPQKSLSRTIARFPVRCGPKQFTAYLNDMGTLQLEVLKGTSMAVTGMVHINEIGHLAPQIPINGFFPVFSLKDPPGKIADLYISMAFEPLPTSYDSSSSMPTTDMSVAGGASTDGSLRRYPTGASSCQPVPHAASKLPTSDEAVFMSPIKVRWTPMVHMSVAGGASTDGSLRRCPVGASSRQHVPHAASKLPTSDEVVFMSPIKAADDQRVPTPRGIDSDYSFVIGPGADKKTASQPAYTQDVHETAHLPSNFQRSSYGQGLSKHLSAPVEVNMIQPRESNQSRHHTLKPGSKAGQDLITALLDRGTKLRDAMVVSDVQPQQRSRADVDSSEIIPPTKDPPVLRRSSSGELFREILHADDKERQYISSPQKEKSFDTELKTVELLIGDQMTRRELNSLKALQAGATSPPSSVSSNSDKEDISELEDPVHDTSILEELFYKGLRSSSEDNLSDLLSSDSEEEEGDRRRKGKSKKKRRRSVASDINDPGNRRPPSRRASSTSSHPGSIGTTPPTSDRPSAPPEPAVANSEKPAPEVVNLDDNMGESSSGSDSETGSTSRMSDGSRVSFDGPQEEEPHVSPSQGLSVERLTLIGKVHIARVMVDTLSLEPKDDENTPTRPSLVRSNRASRMRGKPPRPASRTPKKSYFVEYQFPVVASSQDKSLVNAIATEVMRLVSKKVTDTEASFGHRSVFPVSFNGTAVDRWWKQMVVFKVFSRTPGQKTPTLLGVSSLRLRQVLQSPDLVIQQDLPVCDKSASPRYPRGQSLSSSRSSEEDSTPRDSAPEIGRLKVTVELGSDNKDFSMAVARTKVAEMRGAKIVPLPSNQTKLPIQIPTRRKPSSSTTAPSSSSRKQISKPKQRTSQGIQTDHDQQAIQPQVPTYVHDKKSPHSGERQDNIGDRDEPERHRRQVNEGQDQQVDEGQDADGHGQQVQYVDRTESNVRPHATDHEGLTLHSLLLIPEGRGITLQGVAPLHKSDKYPQLHQPQRTGLVGWGSERDMATRNTYLVCRMFWSDDCVWSNVCWGTPEPNYNFMQVAPVLLTASLLERTRNNVMVIEVWDKKTSAQNDQLVGIAKVSLHQLYMSFRDRRIANTLLKSQFPVVAVDNYINITDPFTATQFGQIKVLLALGSMEQISALQRLKCDKDMVTDVGPERPAHYLERGETTGGGSRDPVSQGDGMVEHVFEVVVEGVRGLTQLDDSYWGEADCFVQYQFPSQPQQQTVVPGHPTQAGAPTLKPHRTATTLCLPDPTFHDVTRHRIVLPQGIPAQRELLTACAGVGGGVGGIPFEVWNRYYYPNIRDQVAAKTILPLAKLCAMVTMQRHGEPSVQTFSLPLKLQHVEEDNLTPEQKAKLQDAGLLDVTISYKNAVVRESTRDRTTSQPGGPHVCLSVGVVRACGLKMAARHLARFDAGLQYASEVGVNAYVKMELSFLAKDEIRISRTIARTFSPEFSHHVDFPCPLLLSDGDNDTISLAEALETAELKLQVWHQTPGFRPEQSTDYRQLHADSAAPISGRQLVPGSVDVLMGTAVIPLHYLLTHRTGIQGWFPLNIPSQGWAAAAVDSTPSQEEGTSHQQGLERVGVDSSPSQEEGTSHQQGLERVGGGLELAIKFAHGNDREKVIDAARSIGWSPNGVVDDVEIREQDQDADSAMTSSVTIHTDAAWFPELTALRPGQETLDDQAKAYIRYKFYDKAALCSKLCYLDISRNGFISADFKHSQRFQAANTPPFTWYLREESLEVQLWVSYNQEHAGDEQTRPRHRDKLIGCAYVDLSPLVDKRSKHHRVSGLYPLFKPGASNLGGACMRIHINMKTSHRRHGDQHELDTTDTTLPPRHPPHPSSTRRRHRHSSMDKQELVQGWLDDEEQQETERQRKAKEVEEQRLVEEEAQRNRPVSMKVLVERAMHLPTVQDAKGLHTLAPSCYTTFQSAEEPLLVQSPTVVNSNHPTWGYEANIKVSKEVLDNQCFVIKLWHQTGSKPDQGSDRVLGFCSIDTGPLLAGFRSLNGWYNIMDFSGQCHGQIKVSITPCESLSPLKLKKPPKQRTLTMSPNTSSVFVPGMSYVIPHPIPPATSNTDRNSANQASSSSTQGHFEDHLNNIRRFHQELQDKLKVHLPDMPLMGQSSDRRLEHVGQQGNTVFGQHQAMPSSTTTSFLVQNLRKNLQELDVVHQKLQQRLSTSEGHDRKHKEPSQLDTIPSHQSSSLSEANVLNENNNSRKHTSLLDTNTISSYRTEPNVLNEDRGEQSSESNSLASERTRSSDRLHHQEHAFDAAQAQDGFPSRVGRDLDAKGHGRGRSPSSDLSDDWEDSVQFGGTGGNHLIRPSDERHEEVLQPFSDKEDFDGEVSDVVVPRALNDISSPDFGNGARTDFTSGYPISQPGLFDNVAGADFIPSYPNPQSQTLQEQTRLQTYQEQGLLGFDDRSNELPSGSKTGETEIISRTVSERRKQDHQRSLSSSGSSFSGSDDENHHISQERLPPRSEHHRTLPYDTERPLKSNEERTRVLADTTNWQHIDDLRNKAHIDENVEAKMSYQRDKPHHTKLISDEVIDISKDDAPDIDLGSDIPTRHSPVDSSRNLPDEVFGDTVEHHQQARTHSHGVLQRQHSDDLSSEDSVVLTIDPEVAERQQRLMREQLEKTPVPSSTKSSSAPVPNFFLPPQDLEASMRALHNAVTFLPRDEPRDGDMENAISSNRSYQKGQAAAELASKLSGGFSSLPSVPMETQPPYGRGASFGLTAKKPKLKAPSADEAKRIAKIFGSKYSVPL